MKIIKFNYKHLSKDHLPYSKATSSFFQQHQFIIFVAFIILCIGLLIITSLTLIYFILETRRRQKRHRSRYSQSDSKFSSEENLLFNPIIIIITILDYSDVFMFKRMNNQQEKFNYNNNRNDNIMKHNLNNKDIESVSSNNILFDFLSHLIQKRFHFIMNVLLWNIQHPIHQSKK